MENCISLLQLDCSIYEGVIALFDLEYFIKSLLHTNSSTF